MMLCPLLQSLLLRHLLLGKWHMCFLGHNTLCYKRCVWWNFNLDPSF